jgi:hypothetical protein
MPIQPEEGPTICANQDSSEIYTVELAFCDDEMTQLAENAYPARVPIDTDQGYADAPIGCTLLRLMFAPLESATIAARRHVANSNFASRF